MSRYVIPVRTYSALNMREHWAVRHRRNKTERQAAQWTLPAMTIDGPLTVTLIRVAPRKLDGDNLQGALKACRDGVADRLGVDDGDGRVEWHYGQAKGRRREYAVIVHIEATGEGDGNHDAGTSD